MVGALKRGLVDDHYVLQLAVGEERHEIFEEDAPRIGIVAVLFVHDGSCERGEPAVDLLQELQDKLNGRRVHF